MSSTNTVTQTLSLAASTALGSGKGNNHVSPIRTIDELIRQRAIELGSSPLIGYPRTSILDYEEHSARALDQYADAAVEKLQALGLSPVDRNTEKNPVIGILAQSGLHVIVMILGLARLGYTVFLISTRLAAPALSRLLKLTDCATVLTTSHFHSILAEVRETLPQLEYKPILVHSDYYGRDAPKFCRVYDPQNEANKIAAIIHSSGSTGLPHPILLSNANCIATFAANLNMRALIASPLFHSHGFYETFRSIYSSKPIYYCNYAFPLTRQSLTDMVNTVKPELFHVVPYMIKLLAETEDGIRSLLGVKMVLFGGSACPDDLGQQLVDRGVNLVGNYGSTEVGRLMNSARPPGDKAWNYLRLLPWAEGYVSMDKVADGLYECVALDGLKSKSTTNSDDPPGSYRTRDLLIPHPTREGLWKYVCRLDDRFTLINGEKVLPIPIEGRIRQDELVKEACLFGEGRSLPGVLIIKADRASHLSDGDYIKRIWPAVEAANSKAETFSRIPVELVVVLPAEVQYPRTDKGTFIRVPMCRQFQVQIDAAYDAFENEEVGGSLCLNGPELEEFLLQKMRQQIGVDLSSTEQDFFASGVDSLQCMQMWSLLKRELDLRGRQAELSQNVLYEAGNIKNLASHLNGLRTGDYTKVSDEDNYETMRDLISRYAVFKHHAKGPASSPTKDVILLTGATGGLGAHLTMQLAQLPSVVEVWAMIRASTDQEAAERLADSLDTRAIKLSPEEHAKVVPLACNFSHPDLGLQPERLSSLLSSLTCCIHSAWAVNFNIPVQSFENEHLKATHNLIQLCLSVKTPEPARFYFCSSVSAAGGSPRPGTVPEGPVNTPMYAQNTGYAKSKYVAEHITLNSAKDYGAPARVLRIGQLVGDTRAGVWNATEGIPLMMQTATTIGCLPALDEEMTWLPVDLAAKAILDLAQLTGNDHETQSKHSALRGDANTVYHVLNPIRFHWTREMIPALAKAGLEFELLPTQQWMERLRNSDRDAAKNPPIKLLNWFESKYGSAMKSSKTELLVYSTDKTVQNSPTLAALPPVTDQDFVLLMVQRLKKTWGDTSART